MKHIIRFFGVFLLLLSCMNVSAAELIHTDINKELELKVEDPYSETILQKGLFSESKLM